MTAITMRDLFDDDIQTINDAYEESMRLERDQFEQINEAHKAKLRLMAEQRDAALRRTEGRYGFKAEADEVVEG